MKMGRPARHPAQKVRVGQEERVRKIEVGVTNRGSSNAPEPLSIAATSTSASDVTDEQTLAFTFISAVGPREVTLSGDGELILPGTNQVWVMSSTTSIGVVDTTASAVQVTSFAGETYLPVIDSGAAVKFKSSETLGSGTHSLRVNVLDQDGNALPFNYLAVVNLAYLGSIA